MLRIAMQRVVASSMLAVALGAGCTTGGTTDIPDVGVGTDAAVDSGPVCPAPDVFCDGVCTQVTSDDTNCGMCGLACPAGVGCVGGRCSCIEPMIACDGACIDPRSDVAHCGACGTACAAGEMCAGGACVACDPPNEICMDGSETVCADLQTDTRFCGSCRSRCATGALCEAGRCMCPSAESPCDGACTDLMIDPLNCGTCRNTCGTGGSCDAGTCMCGTDRVDCGEGRCNDLMTDPRHCGACDRACASREVCTAGECVCEGTRIDCGAGCIDPMTDAANCGGCGTDCGPGGACVAGACTCAAGLTLCDGSCRNTTNDRMNCGACDVVCPAGEYCVMSVCTDAPPTRYMQTTASAAEAPFIDACAEPGHTTILAGSDDGSMRITLPFPFRYWATDLAVGAMINVCSNGWIGMDGSTICSLSGTIPSTSTPNAMIAPHWGDLVQRGGICIATVGTAPYRQLVIQWDDSTYFPLDDGAHNTFEIVLHETTGTIDLIFESMMATDAHTTGIEDQTGGMGLNACPAGTGTCAPLTGQRIRFLPIP